MQYIEIGQGHGKDGFSVDSQCFDFFRFDAAFGVAADFAVDGYATVINQPLALFAAA